MLLSSFPISHFPSFLHFNYIFYFLVLYFLDSLHLKLYTTTMIKTIYWLEYESRNCQMAEMCYCFKWFWDFFKLMGNSVFDKIMENLRNRSKINLVTSDLKLKKLTTKPSIKNFTIFHEKLIVVERNFVELLLNRPISVGFAISNAYVWVSLQLHQVKVS